MLTQSTHIATGAPALLENPLPPPLVMSEVSECLPGLDDADGGGPGVSCDVSLPGTDR